MLQALAVRHGIGDEPDPYQDPPREAMSQPDYERGYADGLRKAAALLRQCGWLVRSAKVADALEDAAAVYAHVRVPFICEQLTGMSLPQINDLLKLE